MSSTEGRRRPSESPEARGPRPLELGEAPREARRGFLSRIRRFRVERMRQGLTIALVGMLAFSGYGTLIPASARCILPGAVGCPGGLLGPAGLTGNATLEMFFSVTMYDYGFWIVNTATGVNESGTWYIYEGWTIHVNATSVPADPSVGGAAYHGLGVELNATGKQLLAVSAPVGRWVSASFVAPTSAYYHQHIWCTIECGDGHSGMYLYNLNIIPATFIPSVTASANVTQGAAPLSVGFTGKISGGTPPYTDSWNFGDGSATVASLNATHVYTLSGTYSAAITVTDSKGFHATGSVSITVSATSAMTATAAAGPAAGYAPLVTTLTSSVTGGVTPYTYHWEFGDGATSALADPSHLYSAPGVFSATLTVTDAGGSTASAQASVTVQAATGHFAVTASAAPASGAAPLATVVTATPSGGTAPYTTAWVFGDGTVGSGASVQHTFSTPGAYEVSAFVTDAAGRVGWNLTAVTVTGTTTASLQAIVTESPSSGSPPLSINASVSALGGSGQYRSFAWAFGDGSSGTGPVVSHRYPALGTFQLTATVTDSLGATASSTVAITVAGVILTISLNRTSGDAPFAVSAAASVLGGTGTYNPVQWSWGDGTTSTGNPANHTYASTVVGSVMIQGTTSDSAGQRANATASVKIAPAPLANLSALVPSAASPPVSVDFMLTVSGGTGNFTPLPLWSFGDGTSTRAANPTNHTYQLPGHYHVTVQTNDSLGAIAIGNAWVNLSTGGLAGGIGVGGGGGGQWVFTGVDNPDQAALALMGLVAISGLALLYRTQQTRSAAKAGAKAARPSPPSVRPGVRPVASGVRAPVRPVGAVQSTRPAGAGAPTPVRTWSPPPPPAAPPPPPVW